MEDLQNENSTVFSKINEIKGNSTDSFNDDYIDGAKDIIYSSRTQLFLLVFEYVGSVEYLICFMANLFTIVAVVKCDYLHRKSTNILILSLSIADSLLGNVGCNIYR